MVFVELGFPSMASWFLSFVNKPNRLCVSIFVSGAMSCVLFIFSFCFFLLLAKHFCSHFAFLLLLPRLQMSIFAIVD